MGTKYSTILVGGVVQTYADGSPSDDGSETEANRVKYATITSDLTAPLHSAIINMDTKLAAHVNEGPDTESSTATLTTADHNKVLEATGTITLSLPNPSGNAGFQCTVKNAGSGTVTVDVDGGANIDGGSSISLGAGEAAKVYVNNAGTAYYSVTGNNATTYSEFPSGTKMLFEQDTVSGWTKKTAAAYNNVAMRISTGTVTDVTSGSVDFDTVFGITATDAHTLLESQIPGHTHGGGSHTHDLRFSDNTADRNLTTTGYLARADTGGGGLGRLAVSLADNTAMIQAAGITTSSTGGSGSHTHNIDLRVRYRDVCVFEKD